MSDRKVLNKYIPPDYDPSIIPRMKKPKDRQQQVRLMTPYSMRCNRCGEFIYKGKKFNARKEEAIGEEYYGIKVYRFYIKCTLCSSEITFKTDPKNTDYQAEHGATRNFEAWRETSPKNELDRLAEHEEGQGEEELDPMKELEKRTEESKREMEIMDALSDIRTRNAKNERLNIEDVLNKVGKSSTKELNEEDIQRMKDEEKDEEEVSKVFGKLKRSNDANGDDSEVVNVKRKLNEPTLTSLLSESSQSTLKSRSIPNPQPKKKKESKLGIKLGVKVKK